MKINGKTALITGGVSGIGKTTARMLAARGARLMLVDVNQQLGDETVSLIEAEGGRAELIRRPPGFPLTRPSRTPSYHRLVFG